MKKYILLAFVSTMLVGLTACTKDEEENPLCDRWYVNPENYGSGSDYYYFRNDYGNYNSGSGWFYDYNYSNGGSLSCDFSWEADDKHLFLHYDYYNSYTKKYVEKKSGIIMT